MRVERRGHVAEVILRGPGKGNAMGPDFWREMPIVFRAFDAEPEVRAVVVYGDGPHLTYGLDVAAMMADLGSALGGAAQLAGARTRLLETIARLQGSFDAVAACRKPVIAALHGWCIGGGLDLAAACDVRLCSADTRISLREVKLAIVADLGSLQRLPPIIGQGHTRELAYTGKNVDSDWALRTGLVNEVLPDKDALLVRARALADEIAANPPLVVQGIKQVMGFTADPPVAEGLRFVAAWNSAFLQSADLMEAVSAMMSKRTPVFRGE
ncbi:MAG: crotonase/enoyl-CoA hydratase family protein [Deltaproteobacteria bacterium]|nr:crotonase/enoyl-CoA hydratase family protein [Deltaproteobacteria bacterium]